MSTKPQIELFLENESGTQQVAYPFVESDHVSLSNGMDIDTMIRQDVSMPTVTHEDLSFKVGVGDQDVSSAIVDSSVAEMTIKGKTYQNILPEPSTHVLTNNKEMFKVNEGLDPNVEIVDGVSKSAILKGQTLVNLATENSIQFTTAGDWKFLKTKQKMLNTTKNYMVKFNSSHDYKGYVHLRDKATNTYITDARRNNFKKGSNVVLLGSFLESDLESFSNIVITFFSDSDSATNLTITDAMLIEYQQGMENWDIPYFTGMQSVKMPVLKATGKNLLDISQFDKAIEDGKNVVYLNNYTPNIPYKENTRYFVKYTSKYTKGYATKIKIEHTDGTKKETLFSSTTFQSGVISSEPNKTVKSITFFQNTHDNTLKCGVYVVEETWIEEGGTSTSYEPYKTNILTVNEDIELRGIGKVQDELNVMTGEVVERVGEIVLDGSEDWTTYNYLGTQIFKTIVIGIRDDMNELMCNRINKSNAINNDTFHFKATSNGIEIMLDDSSITTIDNFKQYISLSKENPIIIQYKLATKSIKTVDLSIIDQDGNTPEGLHFFKDGHIIQSSGADNSLIPTLDYQAKTSNSYVMDLMKTNTKYTMKAKSVSGTFTIDGTSYGAGTNGAFTTPTSMTNKFLVMSNNANEEVMILEGDVTDKTIPYFKGIKSAFEDESKIEVLSTSKNLLPSSLYVDNYTSNGITVMVEGNVFTLNGTCTQTFDLPFVPQDYNKSVKLYSGKQYKLSINRISGTTTYADGVCVQVLLDDGNVKWAIPSPMPMDGIATWFRFVPKVGNVFDNYSFTIQLEEAKVSTDHEPHKSNSTKIPLLSPLRSLPNGVCDELIIDRMKKKATLIQRVGVGVLDGTQNIKMVDSSVDTSLYQPFFCGDVFGNMAIVSRNEVVVRCDKLLANSESPSYEELTFNAIYQYPDSSARLAGQITKKDLGVKSVKDWFRANPTTIYYQLATPVVTEVDLEGFPYIYKDGHIFLNGEITPVTEIKYSINQQHQIEASNQDIIRHQKEIDYLYKLIGEYVRVDYKNTLLSLNLELK